MFAIYKRLSSALIAAIVAALALPLYGSVEISRRFWWHADSLSASCGASCDAATLALAPNGGEGTESRRLSGRSGSALNVNSRNRGYRISGLDQDQAAAGRGFAWMASVWLDRMPAESYAILAQEDPDPGPVAGFRLWVASDGRVALGVGKDGEWAPGFPIFSNHHLGVKAWHHVAFVGDRTSGRLRLYINGIEQGSWAPIVFAEQGPAVPVTVGASPALPGSVLEGAVDDVKYVQFLAETFNPDDPFVLDEPALRFRKMVMEDLFSGTPSGHPVVAAGDYDRFRESTYEATSILRAWVNSFFTVSNKSPEYNGPPTSECVYGACEGTNAPNGLYVDLRDGKVRGRCGAAALTLWAVYRAFGYSTRWYDFVDASDFDYTNSHVLTDVYVTDAARHVLQDPLFNIGGRSSKGYHTVMQTVNGLTPELESGEFRYTTEAYTYMCSYRQSPPCYAWSAYLGFFTGGIVRATPSWREANQ